jgi:hypothetical protein
MELAKRFKKASECTLLRVDQLILNRAYSVTMAVRLSGCHLLSARHSRLCLTYILYLPVQYADVISEKDIHQIKNDKVWISLTYKDLRRDGTPILEVT